MTVSASTLIAVLDALGVSAATEDDRAAAIASHDRDHWTRSLPPVIVGRSGTATPFWVHVTHGDPVRLWLRLEDGSVRTGLRQLENNRAPFDLDGRMVGEATFELPADLPLGYHRLHLQVGSSNDADTSTPVIVSPSQLEPPTSLGAGRAWGLATQLYSVRSRRSWGIGDLTDLTDLAVWSAAVHGAGFVLVNPLHAAAPTAPMEPSPYLPTSRRFVNPMYLRVEADPRVRRRPAPGPSPQGEGEPAGAGRSLGADRPRQRVEGQTRRAGGDLPRRTVGGPRPRLLGVPGPAGSQPRRLRHLVRAGRELRQRLAPVAGGAAAPGLPRGRRVRRGAPVAGGLPPLAAVASSTSS